MFTDIVSYTEYCDTHGEEAGLQLVTEHESVVFPCVANNGGAVVKTIGDAVMACFTDPEHAATAGLQIMESVAVPGFQQRTEPLRLRAVLHAGSVMVKDDDLYGDVVNVASRMLAVAQPGQILISRTMAEELERFRRFHSRLVGTADFHGKKGPIEIYELLVKLPRLKQKTKARILERSIDIAEAVRREARLLGHGVAGRPHLLRFLLHQSGLFQLWLEPNGVTRIELENNLARLLDEMPAGERDAYVRLSESVSRIIHQGLTVYPATKDLGEHGSIWRALADEAMVLLKTDRANLSLSNRIWIEFLQSVPDLLNALELTREKRIKKT